MASNRILDRFNPHPTRRLGATLAGMCPACLRHCFNPHPTRRLGATSRSLLLWQYIQVSILTQPEGWVLRPPPRSLWDLGFFSRLREPVSPDLKFVYHTIRRDE